MQTSGLRKISFGKRTFGSLRNPVPGRDVLDETFSLAFQVIINYIVLINSQYITKLDKHFTSKDISSYKKLLWGA